MARSSAHPLNVPPVDVWESTLSLLDPALPPLHGSLDKAEQERAKRYRFADDRRRFTAARGMLRHLLGDYLNVPPSQVRFTYGVHGKPTIAAELGGADSAPQLEFNVAHSGERLLIAVTRDRQVGIDVEKIRPDLDYMRLAQRFFALQEVNALRALSHETQRVAFFRLWTRKEAFVKALGSGVALGLDRFTVSLNNQNNSPCLQVEWLDQTLDDSNIGAWSVVDLEMEHGYVASLCVAGEGMRIARRTWTGPEVK